MSRFFYSIKILVVLAVVSFMTITCRSVQKTTATEAVLGESTVVVVEPIKIPSIPQENVYAGLHATDLVFEFYKRNGFEIQWLKDDLLSEPAVSLIEMIKVARRYGLLPQHYHAAEIAVLTSGTPDKDETARLDIILTDAFLNLLSDLKNGRLKRELAQQDTTGLSFLQRYHDVDVKLFLESQQPLHAGYHSLKYALNTMLDTLTEADKKLLMSGVTLDSLEAHRNVRQLEINMDRWRAEKQSMFDHYVWVNIPSFMLSVIEQDKVVWGSRIIVGAPITPTPEFSSNIECFTVFPYWYLPRKIAVNEYLPVIKKDTTFITRNNFDVLDKKGNIVPLATIDWSQYGPTNFPFTLRQREGRENSLGIIKFIFDNPYAVYVHDTNSKSLFKKQTRALSHGCIRLEKAVEFAHHLIREKRTLVTSEKLNTYLQEERRTTVSLVKSVPIHIRYFTAEVKDGLPKFYHDVYKKDAYLIDKIYNTMLY